MIGLIYIDFEKAFDSVVHTKLLQAVSSFLSPNILTS